MNSLLLLEKLMFTSFICFIRQELSFSQMFRRKHFTFSVFKFWNKNLAIFVAFAFFWSTSYKDITRETTRETRNVVHTVGFNLLSEDRQGRTLHINLTHNMKKSMECLQFTKLYSKALFTARTRMVKYSTSVESCSSDLVLSDRYTIDIQPVEATNLELIWDA